MYSHSLFLEVFYLAEMFNSDVSKWVTSSVTTLRQMFEGAKMFNSDISKWDVSSATDMRQCTYTLSCYFLFWRTCADNMYHMCTKSLKTNCLLCLFFIYILFASFFRVHV